MIFLKVVLLLVYLILLVAVYRVVDYIAWSDPDGAARLVNPFELSLKQLRWLLQARGINSHSAIEKTDLSDLVSKSGALTNGEIKAAEDLDTYTGTYNTKTFTEKEDFHDSVERSEDVWLVQIVSEEDNPVMSASEWKKLIKRAHSVGLNTGQVFCKHTPSICESRSSWSSQLLISDIHRKQYMTRHTDATAAFNWITLALRGALEEIPNPAQFTQHWLSSKRRKTNPTQAVYVSSGHHVPVLFAPLKMKFRHDVRFGKLQVSKTSALKRALQTDKELPDSFLCLITNHQIYIYGVGDVEGEYVHYLNLLLFLQSVNPDVNIVFTWSLYVCNLFAILSLFTASFNIFTCVIAFVKSFFAYNVTVLASWLLISSCKSTSLIYFTDTVLEHVQLLATTEHASVMRYYLLHMMRMPLLIVLGYVIFYCTVFAALKALNVISVELDNDTDLSALLLTNERRSFGHNDISRRFIERLATPGLWLHPLVPSDYIDNLPVWEYSGVCISSSDDESEAEQSKYGARTSSPSPTRAWSSNCRDASRGRTCAQQNTAVSSNVKKGLLWSIRSCLRGRSPRFRRTVGPPKGMREEQSCSVCLDNYKRCTTVCGLPCGHVFHHECILSWLHGDRHCCPICRWPAYQSFMKL